LAERKIYLSPAFGRKIKKLNQQEKKQLDDAILDILNEPNIGQEKAGDLTGVLVHKFKINKQLTLLSYTYTDREINLLAFGGHENFYRDLKKYKKA
jgi:mRNA interferase RelE/StbE